jgi:hypothetical protein
MNRFVTMGVLALCSQLAGCFVFFVPGSVVGKVGDMFTGDKGEHCVSRATKVGDRVKDPFSDKQYSVVSLSGTSGRCTNSDIPIRAELALEPAPVLRAAAAPPLAAPAIQTPKPAPSQAQRDAACAVMNAQKPGGAQDQWQAAWQELHRLGMTWRDCQGKAPAQL